MFLSFRRRQLVTAALVANALHPPENYWLGAPSMLVGWPTSELAPHLLTATVVDVIRELRRGRKGQLDAAGLAVAAANAAGLTGLIRKSIGTRKVVEDALTLGLGAGHQAQLPGSPVGASLGATWQQFAVPFVTRDSAVEVTRDIQYADDPKTRLDVYRSRSTTAAKAPVLLHIHGGMWMSGNKSYEGLPLMFHMAARGWVCVNVNYRFAPKNPFPAQIIDVKRAIAWIRQNAERFGADPTHIAVSGGSAGGHLAALAALTPNDEEYQPGFEDADTSVQAAAPHYGIYDFAADSGTEKARRRRDRFLAPWVLKKDAHTSLDDFERASPLLRANADAPPFFVIHGADDTGVEVEESRHFVRRMREVSRQPVVYAELPGAQHAFDMLPSIRSAALLLGLEGFLEYTAPRRKADGTRRPGD